MKRFSNSSVDFILGFNISKLVECVDHFFYLKTKKIICNEIVKDLPEWGVDDHYFLINKSIVSQTNKIKFVEFHFLSSEYTKIQSLIFDKIISDLFTIFDKDKNTYSINERWINKSAEYRKNIPHTAEKTKKQIDIFASQIIEKIQKFRNEISNIRSNFVAHHNADIFHENFLSYQQRYLFIDKETAKNPKNKKKSVANGINIDEIQNYLYEAIDIFSRISKQIKYLHTPDDIHKASGVHNFIDIENIKIWIFKELKFHKLRINFKTHENFLRLEKELCKFRDGLAHFADLRKDGYIRSIKVLADPRCPSDLENKTSNGQ